MQLLTIFYNMFPEQSTVPAAPDDRSHDQSRDQTATPTNEGPTFQQMLSSAIRVSLTGDTEGMEGEGEVGKEGERNGDAQVTTEPVMQVSVPEDLPVDLRVKLAVCLVHLSLPLPPSLLPSVLAQPEDYGDLFMDLADAYTENGEHTAISGDAKLAHSLDFLRVYHCCLLLLKVPPPKPCPSSQLWCTRSATTRRACG